MMSADTNDFAVGQAYEAAEDRGVNGDVFDRGQSRWQSLFPADLVSNQHWHPVLRGQH
jgi:hypothetical protein